MLQYTPNLLQWLLITWSGPLSVILLLLGAALIVWIVSPLWQAKSSKLFIATGVAGLLFMGVGVFLPTSAHNSVFSPSFASEQSFVDGIATELESKAKLQGAAFLHLETTSETPLSDGSISFIGTATDVDGDPRQFRYTQYREFGVYEMVGFDKPAVDLKDESLKNLEEKLDSKPESKTESK